MPAPIHGPLLCSEGLMALHMQPNYGDLPGCLSTGSFYSRAEQSICAFPCLSIALVLDTVADFLSAGVGSQQLFQCQNL